jgi:hypothetical protein
MGILANSVSICHFEVRGEYPAGDLFTWVGECLGHNAFQAIEHSADESSVGWVHLDDHQASSFDTMAAFRRDHYLAFALRRDIRRLPGPLVKAYLAEAEAAFLSANPNFRRVPKQKREEMKETVCLSLFARTLPAPATFDVLWDTRNGLITFTSLSPKVVELFENLFKKSFPGLRLVVIHPFARGERVLDEAGREALQKANLAGSDAVLDLISRNCWIGTDFLLWLMYRTMNDSGEYRINQPGPATVGDPFVAFLNDRLVLRGGGDEGVQKITVAGPQDHFSETYTALKTGKQIIEATLYLEKDDERWKTTLKGELFHFGAFRSPPVKIEKDDTTDPQSEREAVFFERMFLLETGLQLFDSLYAAFLKERLGDRWSATIGTIQQWLEAEE